MPFRDLIPERNFTYQTSEVEAMLCEALLIFLALSEATESTSKLMPMRLTHNGIQHIYYEGQLVFYKPYSL